VGEDDGWNYIVFEFIDGVNVRDLVNNKGPLPLGEAINYTLQVAEALDHAAKRSVVHRDIKPSNVLVMRDGVVKLVDMGLARLHQVETNTEDLTASGVTLGTFDYISPEQARDPRSADARSDLYSLGCTLYYMLTCQPPFPEGTVLQKLLSHSSDEAPDVRNVRPDTPEPVAAVLAQLLAKVPDERFQKPSELIAELLVIAKQLGIPVSTQGQVWIDRTDQVRSWWVRSAAWVVPIVLLVWAAIGIDWIGNTDGDVDWRLPQMPVAEAPIAPDQPAQEPGGRTSLRPRDPVDPGGAPTDPVVPNENGNSPPPPASTTSDAATASPSPMSGGIGPPPLSGEVSAVPLESGGVSAFPVETATSADDAERERLARTIVVASNPNAILDSPAAVTGTLDEALLMANEIPGVSEVELRFDGALVHSAFRAVLPRAIHVRAGRGYSPVIVFQPQLTDLSAGRRMIEVVGESLTFSAVHFHLELPDVPAEAWSMFYVDGASLIDLRQCTLTIRNADSTGRILQPQVSFFEIRGATPESMRRPGSEGAPQRLVIALNETNARGQATLVRAVNPASFAVRWQQGVFVSSARILEAIGPAQDSESELQLDLRAVTLVCKEGLALLDMEQSTQLPPKLSVSCGQSIVVTNPSSPLVEHRGVEVEVDGESLGAIENRFSMTGADNFYPNMQTRWRVVNHQKQVFNVSYDQVSATYDEKSFQRDVMWRQEPPPEMPLHLHTASMYRQVELDNPASDAGFDAALMVEFPLVEADGSFPVMPLRAVDPAN
ncbi:MAG: protein kinase, partial [Pirellulaceae bacterium]|jgi:serine/threonine-protein kinase|nr:protein kinase [Pirellulaceae bacterium]